MQLSHTIELFPWHILQLFFEVEVNNGCIFTESRSGEVNIPKARAVASMRQTEALASVI